MADAARLLWALVDTLALIIAVVVTAAHINDRAGLQQLLQHHFSDGVQRLRHLWVDSGYSGEGIRGWVAGLKKTYKVILEVVENRQPGFDLVECRWVAERTF